MIDLKRDDAKQTYKIQHLVEWIEKHKKLPRGSCADALESSLGKTCSSIRTGIAYKTHPLRSVVEEYIVKYSRKPLESIEVYRAELAKRQKFVVVDNLINIIQRKGKLPSKNSPDKDEYRACCVLDRILYHRSHKEDARLPELQALLATHKRGFTTFEEFWSRPSKVAGKRTRKEKDGKEEEGEKKKRKM